MCWNVQKQPNKETIHSFCTPPCWHGQISNCQFQICHAIYYYYNYQGSCARSPTHSRLFKAFSFNNTRPIQCPSSSRSFYSIQPYWYSRKKRRTDLKQWCVLYISKWSEQFFYQLYSNYSSSHSHQVLLKLLRKTNSKLFKAFHSFSKTIKGLLQFSEIQRLFKAGLEFKAGAGTLSYYNNNDYFWFLFKHRIFRGQTRCIRGFSRKNIWALLLQDFLQADVLSLTQPTVSKHRRM